LLDAIAALRAEFLPEGAQPASHENGGAERRHLTVMFCDLVGSTAEKVPMDAAIV
jgi:class 3 adenylate cyclase